MKLSKAFSLAGALIISGETGGFVLHTHPESIGLTFANKDHTPLSLRLWRSHGTRALAADTFHSDIDLNPTKRECDKQRRLFLFRFLQATATISVTGTALPSRGEAGEIGARITKAVTQSDLGISVRRSVVQGAQVMDKMDGQWEKFSDSFGLGAERSKREGRPKPRDVPDLLPLDATSARSILKASDDTFLSIVSISEEELTSRIKKVDGLVRKSFERSGLSLDESIDTMNADTYNYLSYVHFKAFCDILIEKNINFNQFRKNFEGQLGDKLLSILDPGSANRNNGKLETGPEALRQKLGVALVSVDDLTSSLQSKGMVAFVERSRPDEETVTDWTEDLSELQFSVALDVDVTQNAQILLQEQGYRLFPDYARFAVSSALKRVLSPMKQEVTTDEYYMDTSYSSDPDLFEVKQVLLNVVIESA